MFSSFKETSNLHEKHSVFDSCSSEQQFPNFDNAKQTDTSLWNVQSKSYNNVHVYPGEQITSKLQTMSAHNQTLIPPFEHKASVHTNNPLHCPYPSNNNSNHTLVRPTAVINCHPNAASCCGHPNRAAQHWNPVPQNMPVPTHFIDNLSSHNNHNTLNNEDFRFRADNFYGPMNRQALNQRESMGVNPAFYSRQPRNVPTAAGPLTANLSTSNRANTKYIGSNPAQRTQVCAKCSGNCNESCEFFGSQQITDYSNADSLCTETSRDFVRDNIVCYGGLHTDTANTSAQLCTQWPTNVNPQSDYSRQSNNVGIWLNNSHNVRNGLPPPGYWTEKKTSIPRNAFPHYPLNRQEHRSQAKDQQEPLRAQEIKRLNDFPYVQAPHVINSYSDALQQEKDKGYPGNMCNHVQDKRGEEIQKGSGNLYFKEKEGVSYQNFNQFVPIRQLKCQDVPLNNVHSTPHDRVIFQETQTFTPTVGNNPIPVQQFAQPGVLHPYSKRMTKPCFQNVTDSHIPPQDANGNAFALSKVTESFTTGIAQPPSRFSSHLTYTQSRISKTSNEFCYFPDISVNSSQPASNSYICNSLGSSVPSSNSPENNPIVTSSCSQSVETLYTNSDNCKIVTHNLNPMVRSEHNFNCSSTGHISDLHPCKRLQDSNLSGKLMQVIDTSNTSSGIKEYNNGSSVVLKNISSYGHSSEYNVYTGTVPSNIGSMPFESCGETVFPNNQPQTATIDVYGKQFGHGLPLNVEQQCADATRIGSGFPSISISESTRETVGITSNFSPEKNSAAHSVRRSKSVVSDIKSECRELQNMRQKSNKTGQLDVRQFLATWDEETEDVASPRLPDVVLSSNGTPLYVVECGAEGFSQVSTVTSNSTNEETLQRDEVIRVYEHIQPVQMIETDLQNTQSSDLPNENASALPLLNISSTNHSETLNGNVNVLCEGSISKDGDIDFSQHSSISRVVVDTNDNDMKARNMPIERETNFCDREVSPDCSMETKVKNCDNISRRLEDTVSVALHNEENNSNLNSVNSKDLCVSDDKMISRSIIENHESLHDIVKSDMGEVLRGNEITQKFNCVNKSSFFLNGTSKQLLNNKEITIPEDALQGTERQNNLEDSRSGAKAVCRNNSLDDIAADAFEKLTSGDSDKTIVKDIPENVVKNDNLDCYPQLSCVKPSHSRSMKISVSSECISEIQLADIFKETTFKNREESTEQNIFDEKDCDAGHSLEDTCKKIETKCCNSFFEKNDSILSCIALNSHNCSEIKNKENQHLCQRISEQDSGSSKYTSLTAMMLSENVDDENFTITETNVMCVECNGNTPYSFPFFKAKKKKENAKYRPRCSCVTHKICKPLERSLPCHKSHLALKMFEMLEKHTYRVMISKADILLRISNDHIWKNFVTPSVEIRRTNINEAVMKNLVCSKNTIFSAVRIKPNRKKHICLKSMSPMKTLHFQTSVHSKRTGNLSLPIDMILDKDALLLIRRKLFYSSQRKMHNPILKGNRNKLLAMDESTLRKSSLRCSKLINSGVSGRQRRAFMAVKINLTATDATIFTDYQTDFRSTGPSADHDKFRMIVSLRGNLHYGNQDNFYAIVNSLKTILGRINIDGKIHGNSIQCLGVTGSMDKEDFLETTILVDIHKENLPKFSALLPSSSNPIPDGCLSNQLESIQNFETSDVSPEVFKYFLKICLHSLHENSKNYRVNNISNNFLGPHMLQQTDVMGCVDKHKVVPVCSINSQITCKRQEYSFQMFYNSPKRMLNMHKTRSAGYYKPMLYKSVCGNSYKLGKNNMVCNSHRSFDLSSTDLKTCKERKVRMRVKSKKINNLKRRKKTRSVTHSVSEVLNNVCDLSTGEMGLKRNTADCSSISAIMNLEQTEENSFSCDKSNNNNNNFCRKKQKLFSEIASLSQSSVVENNFFIPIENEIQFCEKVDACSSENNSLLEDCGIDILCGNDTFQRINSNSSPTEVNQKDGCISALHLLQTDSKHVNKENNMQRNVDESEIVISSTSSLTEDAPKYTSSDLSKKPHPFYVFEEDLPDVETYVDAHEVTVVTGTQEEEESDKLPCVVVYRENSANVFHPEEGICTSISSIDVCSESDVITTALISKDLCMNSNCIIVSEDESSGPHQQLPDFVTCGTQEHDDLDFRHLSPKCNADEYQNSTVSSTTNISEIGDTNIIKSLVATLPIPHEDVHDISTSTFNGNLPLFEEEIDFYNSGVLQADSVSDWPYLEEEVTCELQNSDVEGDIPLNNSFCEKNVDRMLISNCSPILQNQNILDKETELSVVDLKESSSSDAKNRTVDQEKCKKKDFEFIDLKCRLSWDKIFDLPKKGQHKDFKIKRRERKIITKSWPYYCKTQSRWKWPKSSDALYRRMSRKTKQINVLYNLKKKRASIIKAQKSCSKMSVHNVKSGGTKAEERLTNTSELKSQTWCIADTTKANTCTYKKEKNNNYVIDSVASDAEVGMCKPIVLVQRLILKRNRDQTDQKCQSILKEGRIIPSEVTFNNDKKSLCSDKSSREKKNSKKYLLPTSDVEDHVPKIKQNSTKFKESHGIIREDRDHCRKISISSDTESKVSRKKTVNYSTEVQNGKHPRQTSKLFGKTVSKNSGECVKELPRVIIKRSPDGSTKYKSFLCLSAATEKHWQPVVILKRDADIEDLVKGMQKCKFSSHNLDKKTEHKSGSKSSEAVVNNLKIKLKEGIHSVGQKDCRSVFESRVEFISSESETNITRRKGKYDINGLNAMNVEKCSADVSFPESTKVLENRPSIGPTKSPSSDSVHAETGKKIKNAMKQCANSEDQKLKNFKSNSKCDQKSYSIESSCVKQKVDFNYEKDCTNTTVTTPRKHHKSILSGTSDTKCFTNKSRNKTESGESSHTSDNSKFYSIHHSNIKHQKMKEKSHKWKNVVKFPKKRHSDCPSSEPVIKKQCLWNRENLQTHHTSSRYSDNFPGSSVSTNDNFKALCHSEDEMGSSSRKCSFIYEKAALQKNELKTGDFRPLLCEKEKLSCEACGMTLENLAERTSHIRQHPYHCRRCHLAFKSEGDFTSHLSKEHPKTKEQHHCLLCEKSFTSSEKHQMHLQGRMHRHVERTQRRTIHTIFTLLTGKACPGLTPLTDTEMEGLGWFPSEPGTVHFYHQATPLQMAVQGWLNYQKEQGASGTMQGSKT